MADYLDALTGKACFRVAPFDERAAVELAAMTKDALSAGDLRAGTDLTRAQLKFDRQIVAIAITRNESTIYSDDKGIAKIAPAFGLTVVPVHELPLPPDKQQGELQLDD